MPPSPTDRIVCPGRELLSKQKNLLPSKSSFISGHGFSLSPEKGKLFYPKQKKQ
jgi:hypothetical protein